MEEIENEFWASLPLRLIPVEDCVYGVRNLSGAIFNPTPIRVEYLPALGKFLVHDGRHRIEWHKANALTHVRARVYYPRKEGVI